MAATLFGIAGCDTMKRARGWLDAANIPYAVHDYKRAGIDAGRLRGWAARVGWEVLLNRQGTTFRKLPDADRADLDLDRAVALMLAHPSAIRRPVLESGDTLLVGFAPERYAAALTP